MSGILHRPRILSLVEGRVLRASAVNLPKICARNKEGPIGRWATEPGAVWRPEDVDKFG